MYDPAGDKYIVYNEPQSKKRLSPCSTFKIYNSLIGWKPAYWTRKMYTRCSNGTGRNTLSPTGTTIIPWHRPPGSRWCGTSRSSPRIGPERMQEYIDKIGYGNKDISGGLTTFWLGSSLQISALEQVDLLNKLYSGQLPFSAANTAILQKNITLSEDGGTKLMGKTGSALRNEKWVSGWFVGCVSRTAGTMSSPRTSKPRTAPTAQSPGDNEIHPEGNGYFVTALAKRHIRNKTGSPLKGSGSGLAEKDIMVAPARATSRQGKWHTLFSAHHIIY